MSSPKVSTFPLIECEFPILNALNKLGDGSLRSTKEAEKVRFVHNTFSFKIKKNKDSMNMFYP